MSSRLLALIERERANAAAGKPRKVAPAKLNALVDQEIIEKLYRSVVRWCKST